MLNYISAQLKTWAVSQDDDAPRYGRDSQGYGVKIPTSFWITFGNCKRRVYAICISNAASCYIILDGTRIFCSDEDLELGYHHVGIGNIQVITPS